MSDGIFLVQGEDLVQLRPSAYPNEDLLQELIAKFPGVLAGEQDGIANRWLLVGREAGLPDAEDGHDRWAVDHLFLDQDAVPTLVEVKLARDTRIRREVVGQMLDYASNAVVYWPIDRLRELFLRQCQHDGRDPDQLLVEALGPGADIESFWGRAQDNLRAGKLRLVFVADSIPRELRRIIEFLNGQMTADVIAIEVKQYLGGDLTTLVPTVIGQTAEAEARKRGSSSRPRRQWDEDSFFAALDERGVPELESLVRTLYDWASRHGWTHTFGVGAVNGSWQPTLTTAGDTYRLFTIFTDGSLEVPLRSLTARPPLNDANVKRELINRLNTLPGVTFPDEPPFPVIRGAELAKRQGVKDRLIKLLTWFAATVAASENAASERAAPN